MALKAFFDETGTHAGHPIIGVAGFLYDEAGINQFEDSWKKKTRDLKRPFHAVDCVWGREEFEGWPDPVRMLLMHDLAEIIADTKLAGFVAFIERKDWELWQKINQAEIVKRVGSPYSACLLHCISMVRDVVKHKWPESDVIYLFEAGCDRQTEAEKFLYDLEKNERSKKNLKLSGHGFTSPSNEPLLCAADFLAWEWQRNYTECLEDRALGRKGHWRSEFKPLLRSKNMYFRGLVDASLSARALVNFFNEHQPDN